ncbi:MAG: hypothetical protein WB789_08270 [Thermoplasmata archaeon]
MDLRDGPDLFLQSLIVRPQSLRGPPLYLQDRRRAQLNPVALSPTVYDLQDTEPEHPKVDDPTHRYEVEGPVQGVRRGGLDSRVTSRTGVARDLHLKGEGLGRREVGDRPPTDFERFRQLRATLSTLFEIESERRGVRDWALARPSLMTHLAAGRTRL